jgi:hypothetical protein
MGVTLDLLLLRRTPMFLRELTRLISELRSELERIDHSICLIDQPNGRSARTTPPAPVIEIRKIAKPNTTTISGRSSRIRSLAVAGRQAAQGTGRASGLRAEPVRGRGVRDGPAAEWPVAHRGRSTATCGCGGLRRARLDNAAPTTRRPAARWRSRRRTPGGCAAMAASSGGMAGSYL